MAWVSLMSAVKKAVLFGSMRLLGNSANSLRADTAPFDRYAIPKTSTFSSCEGKRSWWLCPANFGQLS